VLPQVLHQALLKHQVHLLLQPHQSHPLLVLLRVLLRVLHLLNLLLLLRALLLVLQLRNRLFRALLLPFHLVLLPALLHLSLQQPQWSGILPLDIMFVKEVLIDLLLLTKR
jgi:hypothetical protein